MLLFEEDNLEKHKEIITTLKKKNLEEYNINLVNQKHQIEETLKIRENNLNISKQDLAYYEKNFLQSETLYEHNYSQKGESYQQNKISQQKKITSMKRMRQQAKTL